MSTKEFEKNGYILVKNAINKDLRDFITQYALFDEMQDFSPDGIQVPKAHSKYSDPAMESMLVYLQSTIEEKTGLSVYPTYSFYRIYRNGDILHPHKDRPSCEISATVCLNYSYDDTEYNWPIIMNGKKINMKPGDLVIYRGIELEHSRDEFLPPSNDWHVQAFLHYVNSNGPYSEYKYDQREYLGILKNKKVKKPYITYL